MNTRAAQTWLVVAIAAGALALVGWNASRFMGAKQEIRSKNLDFLPSPEVARVMVFGHTNTVAKLRWIDSFAYFQYQLGQRELDTPATQSQRKDDHVAGGSTGFRRLYETLIALDPKFQPFYEHAAMNISGILAQHDVALAFLMRGTLELPQSRELWRNAATTLKVFFTWDKRQPFAFDGFLAAWEQAEDLPEAKQMVWDWKRSFGAQVFTGVEQLPYWLDQLKTAKAGTPNGDYVEGTIRTLLARYGLNELNALAAGWRISHGGVPQTRRELVDWLRFLDPMQPVVSDGPVPQNLSELLDPKLVRARYSGALPPWGPLQRVNGRVWLRTDPYGYPWTLVDGKVVSPGQQRADFQRTVERLTGALLDAAQKSGSWPTTLDDVAALNITLPTPPLGGTLRLDGRRLVVDWPDTTPPTPWPLR